MLIELRGFREYGEEKKRIEWSNKRGVFNGNIRIR